MGIIVGIADFLVKFHSPSFIRSPTEHTRTSWDNGDRIVRVSLSVFSHHFRGHLITSNVVSKGTDHCDRAYHAASPPLTAMKSILMYASKRLNSFTSYVQPLSDGASLPRKVLLIRAHPVDESYSAALAKAAERGLLSAGHEVRVKSLYRHTDDKLECYAGATFDPVLSADERRGYMDPQLIQERKVGSSNLSRQLIEAIADLRWCNSVVFVFPTWWFSLPAVLKGFFDRTLLPGVAFLLPESSKDAVGLNAGLISGFTNITKIGVVTTYGTPYHVVLYCGDSSRSIISNAVRPICSPDCLLLWSGLYNMDHTTLAEREKFMRTVEKTYAAF